MLAIKFAITLETKLIKVHKWSSSNFESMGDFRTLGRKDIRSHVFSESRIERKGTKKEISSTNANSMEKKQKWNRRKLIKNLIRNGARQIIGFC